MRRSAAKNASCAILAGGESKRIGKDKAGIKISGKTMLERVFSAASPLFTDIMVSVKNASTGVGVPARIIADKLPVKGPMAGLHSALKEARHPWLFTVACDEPLLTRTLVEGLLELRGENDCVIPVVKGRLQTLCALYKKTCLPHIERRIGKKKLGIAEFLRNSRSLKILYVPEEKLIKMDPDLRSFMDVDTAQDLKKMKSLLFFLGKKKSKQNKTG